MNSVRRSSDYSRGHLYFIKVLDRILLSCVCYQLGAPEDMEDVSEEESADQDDYDAEDEDSDDEDDDSSEESNDAGVGDEEEEENIDDELA
ncbi:hypothetical protein ElyMa_000195900 [Elysia marginata]|uniref:Uncharacterized protein n=1 Tax=Elysia marginata TaxID=1093978 RepID=A0AAV4EVN4_9GAST|nr:hypothetical protein ElyMa_000195900 [Elysia marginata]